MTTAELVDRYAAAVVALRIAEARAAQAEAKIQAVWDLLSDPAESHRMLTRKEIGRLLR